MNADLQLRLGLVDENSSSQQFDDPIHPPFALCQFRRKFSEQRNLIPIRRAHFELTLATAGMPVKATDGAAANKAAQASFLRNIVRPGG